MHLLPVLAVLLLLPSGLAQLPVGIDDPAAVLESMAASQHVPRNEGVQRLLPPVDVAGDAPADAGPKAAKPAASDATASNPGPATPVTPIRSQVHGPLAGLMLGLEGATDAASAGQAIMDYYVATGIAPDLSALGPPAASGGLDRAVHRAVGGPATAAGSPSVATTQAGMDVPSRPSEFDENMTITFTYSIGDVDLDGVGDLMLDKYCPPAIGCPSTVQPIDPAGAGVVRSSTTTYGHPHLVEVISGADGRPLWNMSMDGPHPTVQYTYFVSVEFTVGTVPLDDGTYGLLSYQFQMVWFGNLRFDITHTFRVYEMTGGNVQWTWTETGVYSGYQAIVADNVVIHPHLDVRPADGPYAAPAGSQEALTLVGVGYTYTALTTNPVAPPTWDHFPVIVQDYQPDEWAARLDPRTGQEQWRQPTFEADRSRSVLPQSWWGVPMAGEYLPADIVSTWAYEMTGRANSHYWGYRPCCHDLDGDGLPELVYTTLEFTNLPNANLNGPYGVESRVVVFSGADGSLLYEDWLAQDYEVAFVTTRVMALGDVNGDGNADFLLERMTIEPKPEYRWSIRSGPDGSEIWRIDNVRRMDLLLPGDVDADGGNDILLIEWFQHEYYSDIGTPYANVTHTPIKVFSGATGELLWRRESYVAAADLDRMVDNGRINGFPDLDGDGVQDVPIMDPIFLPDGTTIHRTSFYSPVTDKQLAQAISAGAFAVPVRAGDVNGDGREDFTLLNGDLMDLWVTTYDGRDGQPIWSRRITDLRLSSAASAVPLLRNHDIEIPGGGRVDIVVNFQMSYTTLGSYIATSANRQMVAGLVGTNGTLVWSQPRVYDPDATAAIEGASPASALFADLLRPRTLGEQLSVWTPTPAGGGTAFAGALLVSFLISRRLTR